MDRQRMNSTLHSSSSAVVCFCFRSGLANEPETPGHVANKLLHTLVVKLDASDFFATLSLY